MHNNDNNKGLSPAMRDKIVFDKLFTDIDDLARLAYDSVTDAATISKFVEGLSISIDRLRQVYENVPRLIAELDDIRKHLDDFWLTYVSMLGPDTKGNSSKGNKDNK